jgi:hypothetical protein
MNSRTKIERDWQSAFRGRTLCALLLAACGGTGGGGGATSLDCSSLADETCTSQVVGAAESCFPATTSTGKLNADGTQCTTDDGAVINFDASVLSSSGPLRFSIVRDGQVCFRYQELQAGYSVTSSVGTTELTMDDDGVTRLSCPDGSVRSGSTLALLACGDAGSLVELYGVQQATPTGSAFTLMLGLRQPRQIYSCAQ